jgi:hypothetical protein
VNFTSQFGTFDVSSLSEIGSQSRPQAPPPQPQPQAQPQPTQLAGISDADAIVAAIESLAGLHQRGILSDDEFSTKKVELLGRL